MYDHKSAHVGDGPLEFFNWCPKIEIPDRNIKRGARVKTDVRY